MLVLISRMDNFEGQEVKVKATGGRCHIWRPGGGIIGSRRLSKFNLALNRLQFKHGARHITNLAVCPTAGCCHLANQMA